MALSATATASAVYGNNPRCLQVDSRGVPFLCPRAVPPSTVDTIFLSDLTTKAGAAANSLTCGSILAGQRSEGDEYGDIAFWLGEGDFAMGHQQEVVDALGLQDCIASPSKIRNIPLSPSTHLPMSLPTTLTPDIASLADLLSKLKGLHVYRVEGLAGAPSMTTYILLGHLNAVDGSSGWMGLMGVGVWT